VLTTLVDNTYSHGEVGLYDNQPGPGGSGPATSFSNFSVSNSGVAPLTNVNNTITSAGQLGDGQLTLVNDAAGIINGSATNNALTISTGGSGSSSNAGTVEATGAGGLVITNSATTNTGTIEGLTNSTLTITSSTVTNTSGNISATGSNAFVALGGATVAGTAAADVLTNVDNTISGGGQLGDGQLTLINQAAGIIDGGATANALTLDTGSGSFSNAGTIESTGGKGLLILNSTGTNTGTIQAVGSSAVLSMQSSTFTGGTFATSGGGTITMAAKSRSSAA
jgi:hypothetical protein